MKFLPIVLTVLVSFTSLQALARNPVPVINYESVPVTDAAGALQTAAQVKQAIQKGAAARQWTLQDQGPGRMLATLQVKGKHTVMTQINYADGRFSVVYNDSINMKYSPGPDGKGEIHPGYNKWVQELKEAIRTSQVKG